LEATIYFATEPFARRTISHSEIVDRRHSRCIRLTRNCNDR
jgi:hypothetical protein